MVIPSLKQRTLSACYFSHFTNSQCQMQQLSLLSKQADQSIKHIQVMVKKACENILQMSPPVYFRLKVIIHSHEKGKK